MMGKKEGVPFSTKASVARLRWNEEYDKTRCDKVSLRIRKGDKERYHEEASKLGYTSFNQFIIDAVKEKIERGV